MEDQLWRGITDTERLARYFGKLADKLRHRHRLLTMLLALEATGAGAMLIARLPEWAAALMFAFVAATAIWSFLADYSGKAMAADLFSLQYRHLLIEWNRLWYGEAIQAQIDALQTKLVQIPSGVELAFDHKLNDDAGDEAYTVLAHDFGVHYQGRGAAAATSVS